MATERRRGLSAGESTPAVPQAKPTAAKPKGKAPAAAPAKPWWWYVTPAGIANEVKFRREQVQRINKDSRYMGRVGIMPIYMDRQGRVSTSTPSQRDIIRGAAQVPLDVAKAGINVVQRASNGNKAADPASTPAGRVITQAERGLNTAMQLPQPEQRQPEDLFWQQMGNQFTTGVAGGLAAKAFVGANAFTQGAFRGLSPVVQQALRWTAGIGIESGVSTALTDNRQGNLANAFGQNAPMAVQPADDMVSAAFKSVIPNAGAEIAFGLGGLALGKTFGNISRNLQESRAAQEAKGARNWAQENGIQVDNDGVSEFTPEAVQPTPKAEAPAAEPTAEPAATPAAEPAAAPTAKEAEDMLLGPDEEGPVYDPATPEVDVAIQALDRLDDERLQAVAAGAEGPVLPELDRQLGEQQATFQVQEGLDVEMVSAPSQNLANPEVPYEAQWQQLPQNTLISLAAPQNSPDLFQKVQALTGREFEQFTRMDVIDGLKALQAEGKTVLPSRLQDGVTATPVGELGVDPVTFQYKDNVNAQGQQKGNSLDGVTRWNTDLEQVNEVWTSPKDGVTYVINGHNSLAKAKELGIPTVLTKEILANTPEQARAIGALSNIAKGSGTVFDAAKVFRERGITDLAGLDDAGIPLRGGNNEPSLGAKGLALSKLPDNLFQAAINGELPLGRALALGNSGLDPEGMTRVVQLTQGRDMTERGFAELIEMASTAPKVESDQMGLFGAEVIDTTVIKAELAAKVRAELGSSKRLLAMAGKQKNAAKLAEKAGATVDAGQAKDAADVVKGVIEQFDQTKYAAETPISQLLNEGAAEIAAGAKPAVVAKRILAQLEKAAEAAPPAPKAPVEEPAAEAPAEPGPLLPEQRNELKKQVVKRAIQAGEVRPSEAPLPEVPEGPRDLNDPQALLEDELRLAEEYAQQDAIRQQVELEAQRAAMGWDDMTLEQKKANGMLDTWEPDAAPVELSSITDEQELIRSFDVGPAPDSMQAELREVVRDAVFRITGDDASVALHGYLLDKARPPEWGTKTKRIKEAGSYELAMDIVNVRGLLEASPDRVISTAYHESFHRIQFALMTKADMDVFDSVFGKIRVENYAGTRREIATIERQALAFQTFADAKANGLTTSEDLRARIRYEVIDALDEQFPRKNGESWEGTLTERVTSTIFHAFDRLLDFIERVNNGIRGRGFTSVEDFFEKAYAGDIAKKRALDFAIEELTPDQKARAERLRTWMNDNQAALSDIGQAVAGIDVQINALKAQAIAGGC